MSQALPYKALILAIAMFTQAGTHLQAAPSDLETQALSIFAQHCNKCHGPAGSRKAGIEYIAERSALEENGYLVPGSPNDSMIYLRLIDADDPMPPKDADTSEYPRPTTEQIATIKQWIESLGNTPSAASVDTTKISLPAAAPALKVVTIEEVQQSIARFLKAQPTKSRQYWRFFSLTNLHNLAVFGNRSSTDVAYARAALSKALNSVSWAADIVVPVAVDPQATILAVDLRSLGWEDKREWLALSRVYPYGLQHTNYPTNNSSREAAAEVAAMAQAELPVLRVDWFVATATRPPLYERLLGLPDNVQALEEKLKVDVVANLLDGRARRAGFMDSKVSKNANRMVERHPSAYGYYWKSYDFLPGTARSNLLQFPLGPMFDGHPLAEAAFTHDGGEMIFTLPNGLQAYYLATAAGKHIDSGPPELVNDDNFVSGSPLIVNGVSCMACHEHGMIRRFTDQVRLQSRLQGDGRDLVELLYMSPEELQQVLDKDEARFLRALELTIGPFLRVADAKDKPIRDFAEPIKRIAANYNNAPLSPAIVAAELGLADPAALKLKIENDDELVNLGLAPLAAGQNIKREFWQSNHDGHSVYQRAALRLRLGVPRSVTAPASDSSN